MTEGSVRSSQADTLSRAIGVLALLFAMPLAPAKPLEQTPPTFADHIAPILFDNCAACHHPGASAPFSLLTYRDARRRGPQIVDVTESGFMPPWLPKQGYGEFLHERRLSPQQIALLREWVEAGMPEGDSASLKPPEYAEGWQLGVPDQVVELEGDYVLAAEGEDLYRNFVLPVPDRKPPFVRGLEIQPGNPRVVHHAVLRLAARDACRPQDEADPGPGFDGMEMCDAQSPAGQILSWAPGRAPNPGREDLSWPLAPDSDLILQLHMIPSGKPEPVRPRVGLFYTERPPASTPQVAMLRRNDIDIPAGVEDYRIRDEFRLPIEAEVLSLYPHAHYLGKEMQVYAELPDGQRRWLLWIEQWDFNWQDQYFFREPVRLPKGSRLVMEFSYDNSASNPRNPQRPPRRVRHGGRSLDEMGNLALQLLPARSRDGAQLETAILRHLASDPSNPNAWLAHLNLGWQLEGQGRLDEAARHYRQSLAIRPGNIKALNNLGILLRSQGSLDQAIALFRQALQRQPGNAGLLNNLGASLALKGDVAGAVRTLRLALEANPDSGDAHLNLANLLEIDAEETLAHYREALRLKPDNPEAHNGLGMTLASRGQLEEAILHFEKALELRPDYEDARSNLAILRLRIP